MLSNNSIPILFFLFLYCMQQAQGQHTISGQIVDSQDSLALAYPTLSLLDAKDSSLLSSLAGDSLGLFRFSEQVPQDYILRVEVLGYEAKEQALRLSGDLDLGKINLEEELQILDDVVVQGRRILLQVRGDTVEYDAEAIKLNPNADLDDLLKRLQGIQVDKEGNITAQGQKIQKVTIDGKDFFGRDAQIALKNLPANMVSKVQVIDSKTEKAKNTGIDEGEREKILNLVTKEGMNKGVFGNASAAYDPVEQYYNAKLNIHSFTPNHRVSVLGFSNNMNEQGFDFRNLADMNGGTYVMGGGMMNFFSMREPGIVTAHSGAINFSNQWSPQFKTKGNYIYRNSSNILESQSRRQLGSDSLQAQSYNEERKTEGSGEQHLAAFGFEWDIDSMTRLTFDSRLAFSQNQAREEQSNSNILENTILNQGQSLLRQGSEKQALSLNAFLRRKFKKKGRVISLSFQSDPFDYSNARDSLDALYSQSPVIRQYSSDERSNQSLRAELIYAEPLSELLTLRPSFAYQQAQSSSDWRTFAWNPDDNAYSTVDSLLSNSIETQSSYYNGGLSLGYRKKTFFCNIRLDYKEQRLSVLQSFPRAQEVNQVFRNFFPGLNMYNNGKHWRSYLFYRTSNQLPSTQDLQGLVNNRNPLFWQLGNPELKQAFEHSLWSSLSYTVPEKGLMLSASLNGSYTQNAIVASNFFAAQDIFSPQGIFLPQGTQLQSRTNMSGRADFSFRLEGNFLIEKLAGSELAIELSANETRSPSEFNGQANMLANSSLGLSFDLENNKLIEGVLLSLSYSPDYNIARNDVQVQLDQNFWEHNLHLDLEWEYKRFSFSPSVGYSQFIGLSEGFDQRFFVLDCALRYRFLKKEQLTLSLEGQDLLNQRQNIRRATNQGFLEDSNINIIQRFVLLKLEYRFRKVAGEEQVPRGGSPF